MDTKLCRICGKLGQNYVCIFRTEGLKNKIETCLPIVVSPHCLLPDTICGECMENVDNFYSFIKNCLQNIIILEAQYDITESCLKTKRKFDKGTSTTTTTRHNKPTQTDDSLSVLLKDLNTLYPELELLDNNNKKNGNSLVDYEIESDDTETEENKIVAFACSSDGLLPANRQQYFDNYLIDEIAQRKRKWNSSSGGDNGIAAKIPKMDHISKRKNKQPKKCLVHHQSIRAQEQDNNFSSDYQQIKVNLPQVCLLCEKQFPGPLLLAGHVFEVHGIDVTQIRPPASPLHFYTAADNTAAAAAAAAAAAVEKKKRLPNLLKITDLKRTNSVDELLQQESSPPTLLPSFVCPFCPGLFTVRTDLFQHLRIKHPQQSQYLCGICLQQTNGLANLKQHVQICFNRQIVMMGGTTTKYVCQVCKYGDDNFKLLENHILVHEFLLENCRKYRKIFDPADYIDTNENCSSQTAVCSECGLNDFQSFKDFSTHRRSQHSIFHCDLCNKFYGRNSHLWKHVNRLHKGHPSITCQLCYKTSASKYHLAQHFNKIHSTKVYNSKHKVMAVTADDDFMLQKFQAFDFQSVKQSFMRQDLLVKQQQQDKQTNDDVDKKTGDDGGGGGGGSSNDSSDEDDYDDDDDDMKQCPPKEIDSTSNLYTNIITNYTPPTNEGEFKCPKCTKAFHKKTLLKKHKKNCRPRLQKDLLTRCKSCARIFKDRQSLAKHLINYHSEYQCEICKQKVQSKCEIISHIRFQHDNCHLFCPVCGNILRSEKDLHDHTKDHMNSYICQFCGDSLPSKIKLKMHILSLHRKILSLSCGICLKLFETQFILRDHVRLVHSTQLKPLTSCTVCGKNYGSKWKTFDHLNKSHGRIFKACKICLEVFETDLQLQLHYDKLHSCVAIPSKCSNNNNNNGPSATVKKSDSSNNDDNNSEQSDNDQLMKSTANNNSSKKQQRQRDDDFDASNSQQQQQQQQNSSKRTVYVNSNDPSLCEICLKQWPAKKHLWQHYIRCHKSVAATVCGICLKTNDSYKSLQIHLQQTHPTLLHGQGFGSNFICRICGRYHNASSKLKLHMAIHEKFDWTLLEHNSDKDKHNDDNKPKPTMVNGFSVANRKNDMDDDDDDDDINYDSLIEQVECSTGTDDNDGEDEDSEDDSNNGDKSSSDADGEDDDDDDDNYYKSGGEETCCSSENSLETQMLQNMMVEKEMLSGGGGGGGGSSSVKKENDRVSSSSSSSSSDFESRQNTTVMVKNEQISEDESQSSSNHKINSLFQCKSEELDSAIQSISFDDDCIEKVEMDLDNDYCAEFQTANLNDNEIESAVGSIL